jgi:hypothetical protein
MADDSKRDEVAVRLEAERKETEYLLAGFDRPGRTPRTPPVRRDLVEYHLGRRSSDPDVRSAASIEREKRGLPTAIIPKGRVFPPWMRWAALLVVMPLAGVLVVTLIMTPASKSAEKPTSTTFALPSAATTITSGMTVADWRGPERDIPPPPPSAERATTTNESPTAAPSATPPRASAPPVKASRDRDPTSRNVEPSTAPTLAPAQSASPSGSAAIDLIRHM